MKEYSIAIDKYIEFRTPKSIYLQIIPSTGLRNYNTDKILILISNLYRSIDKRITKINNKLFFESQTKVSYYIYMEKDKVDFYFIVPEPHYRLFKDKLNDVWSNKVTITEVKEIPMFNSECIKYYLNYKKENALSCTCDKRNNVLLGGILNTIYMLDDDDKIGVIFNFQGVDQKSWKVKFDKTIDKLRHEKPIENNKFSFIYVIITLVTAFSTAVDFGFNIIGIGARDYNNKPLKDLCLSSETISKREANIIRTQAFIMSESKNDIREHDNAISVCESFTCLDGDNELTYHQFKSKKNINLITDNVRFHSFNSQPREAQNFISVPARELLEQFPHINHLNVCENPVPEELRKGYISLGECTYKGEETIAYFSDYKEFGNMPVVLIGEQGSGKTTYISNYVKDIQKKDEGCIVIDFIKNCELCDSIEKVTPKSKLIILDLSDIKNLQGIGYNELQPQTNKYSDILDISNRKALYIQTLIDALNIDGEPLSTSMDRYLSAACNIVFLEKNACLRDVVRCLNDYEFRHRCINNIIDGRIKRELEEEISSLIELDDTNGGTRNQKVDGINHRINVLRKDYRLKTMFNKDCSDNINLVDAMDEGKIILVKMPQEYFGTPYSKNVIVTYLFTKIWSSMIVRGGKYLHPKRFHVIVDEIFQSKTAMQLLHSQEILPQTRKFGCRFLFSCQYLGQIKEIDQTLRSAGASHMLMKGSGKANFNEFKDELYPYTLEDLENLKQWDSLNMINTNKGKVKFVTTLPPPIK